MGIYHSVSNTNPQLRIVKKRIHKEIGRLGRNIRRKLLCGFYSRVSTTGDCEEDLEHAKLEIERNKAENVIQESLDAIHTENQNGFWEADPRQLPQQQ